MKFSSLLLSLSSLIVFIPPAVADTLKTWSFDRDRNQLTFTTDEAVQPIAQLIPNPSRIVIDLPGIQLDQPKINQPIGRSIRSLRIANFESQTTRLVLDLDPSYTVDAQKVVIRSNSANQWTVQLPPLQPVAQNAYPNSIAIAVPQAPLTPIAPPRTYNKLIPTGQQLTGLKDRLSAVRKKYPSLNTGIDIVDLQTGDHVDFNGDRVYSTASIIKLPILIALFQEIDAGRIRLDETWTMGRDVLVGESGDLQDLPVNSKIPARTVIEKMIIISDNTAANMVIKRLGGIAAVNQKFQQLGLSDTKLRNFLPDVDGTNTTTPKELAQLLVQLDRQALLSPSSQANVLDILHRVKNRKLLAAGLGAGATIAHKTGYIGSVLCDAGIIEMPNGKRYIASVIVKNNRDDAAWDFIPEVSKIVYNYFNSSTNQ